MKKIALLAVVFASLSARAKGPVPPDFPELVARVSQAVVNIQTTKIIKNPHLRGYLTSMSGPGAAGLESTQSSLGSGFVVAWTTKKANEISKPDMQDVLILTNDHVIGTADEIEVMTVNSQERYVATLVAHDPQLDIAVLRASLPNSIRPLRLGDSAKTRVGQSVFAIGNPFGLGHTVTAGILSAKDRSLGISRADRYLQTDAAINFGNSGGPLFNEKGEVIGINTLIRVDAQGIGFAIPSDTVKRVLPELQAVGRIDRGWLGIVAANESTALLRYYKIEGSLNQGVVVTNLVKGGPAHKISLEEGDVITSIDANGETWPTSNVWVLRDALETLKPGTPVEVKIRRGSKQLLGKMKLESMPAADRLPEGHDYY